jgi:dimethylargininase
VALTRGVSPSLARCELTFLEREPIDVARAVAQHEDYCRLLARLGLELLSLPADPAHPDCCFVEDTAIVLDEIAVIARPGAPSRRGEVDAVAEALALHRPLARMAPPATLDGGDVLLAGRRLYTGITARTNLEGAQALQRAVAPFGYEVLPVPVGGCLHLKSAVTALDDDTVLANPDWLDLGPFRGLEVVPVAPGEPGAANVLRLGKALVAHAGFPRTNERIAARGLEIHPVDVSEFLKAEAGVTCKSLVFRSGPGRPAP